VQFDVNQRIDRPIASSDDWSVARDDRIGGRRLGHRRRSALLRFVDRPLGIGWRPAADGCDEPGGRQTTRPETT